MVKKKIILFLPYSLDKDFIKKYDIQNAKKFFNIEFFDLKRIIKKKENKQFKLESELNELKKLLISFKPELGMMFLNDEFHKQLSLYCKKFSNLSIIYKNTHLIPENIIIRPKRVFFDLIFSRNFFSNFLYIFKKLLNLINQKNEEKTKFNFDYSIISGTAGKNISAVHESKKIIKICSEDYKKSFNFKKENRNYSVFLDEDLFYHRDYSRQLKKKKFISKAYFAEMNNFFRFYEKKFKTKIIIALHPKCEKIKAVKKLFSNRLCLIDKTHDLVSKCDYAFAHPSTTSINIPIIYKKPLTFIVTNELLQNFEWKMRLERRKHFLKQPVLNVSNKKEYLNFEPKMNIDKQGYQKYLKYFVKSCNKKKCKNSFWEDLNILL